MSRKLSKSKIIAYRQCPKRLWLELHRPDLRDDSASETVFRIGNEVGEIARAIYDPKKNGELIDVAALGWEEAMNRSRNLLEKGEQVIFEAGLVGGGGLAFADIMIPTKDAGTVKWHLIEVKASTSVKEYHRDDIAIQAWIAEAAGIDLASVSLAHVDNPFVYQGDALYKGLLVETDFTSEVKERAGEVSAWMSEAHAVAGESEEPKIEVGDQCHDPFPCPFLDHCHPATPETEYPLSSLPRLGGKRLAAIKNLEIDDLRDVPDELLTATQQWVKTQTVKGEVSFDQEGAASDLAGLEYPARFLDFETVMFGVPIWEGTRPYEQLPFQFSLHTRARGGAMRHDDFLDLSGNDPSETIAESLALRCGDSGPIFAYNAGFEKRVLRSLADRFPAHAEAMTSIIDRIVDLYPIARNRFYSPFQHGSWSLKAVLPAICPDLSYHELDGIADGGAASEAFHEAIAVGTSDERRKLIEKELRKYCHLDTLALVRLWAFFGNQESISSRNT